MQLKQRTVIYESGYRGLVYVVRESMTCFLPGSHDDTCWQRDSTKIVSVAQAQHFVDTEAGLTLRLRRANKKLMRKIRKAKGVAKRTAKTTHQAAEAVADFNMAVSR